MTKNRTTNAIDILDRRHPPSAEDLSLRSEFDQMFDVAQQVFDLRTKAGLTQQELAERVGTTKSAICRLEDADYDKHSMAMLRRIAAAVNHRVQVRFVPVENQTMEHA